MGTGGRAGRAVGLVLAAGQGSRLGRGAKALLRSGGSTLVQRAVGVLRDGGCAPVLVVVGAQAAEVAPLVTGAGGQVVVNDDWATGLASSFRAGIAAVPAGAGRVVVMVVDQPGIGAEVVTRLLAGHSTGRIAAADYGGSGARHPMVFDVALARQAAALAEGDRGARAFLRRHPGLLDLVDCSDLGSAADVDTPADLHLLDP